MSEHFMTFGAQKLSSRMIEDAAAEGKEVNISVAGFLFVDNDVTADMVEKHVGYVFVNGMILGPTDVKEVLRAKEAACAVPAKNGKKSRSAG